MQNLEEPTRMISTLLIANRGEIACRIIRTARAMGITTVAVYSDPDATAAHVQDADIAVPLPGSTAAETYLDSAALIRAAHTTGADAIHPGYGFLSENAAFAQAVMDADLTWVGPPPSAITAMGDKITAKALMDQAGVPVLPSVTDVSQAHEIGFPLIVKAAAGGGGKGMRVVREAADLEQAVAAARREAAGAFGDDRVFVERFVERPRHIEVQVLADAHGNVVHLGERECSLQRRHQKVIEEAPSVVVDDATRERLGQAAVAAATSIGYQGAGTVEFVATVGSDGELSFYFLEVNTRLQVEHPVTEQAWRVGGDPAPLDLVRLQLLVAEGQRLPFAQDDLRLHACSVEARLYAEDPAQGFLPATGTVELLHPAGLAGTRWDSGVRTGDVVSPFYDPMLAKVVATAPTRTEAIRLLARELQQTRLHGLVTNRTALVAMLRHPDFISGHIDTGFIDRMTAQQLCPPTSPDATRLHLIAAVLIGLSRRREVARVQTSIPPAWRNNRSQLHQARFIRGEDDISVGYAPTRRPETWSFQIGGDTVAVHVHHLGRDVVDVTVEGRRTRVDGVVVAQSGAQVVWAVDSPLGSDRLVQPPRFPVAMTQETPGSLVAPMPGTVVQVVTSAGAVVAKGDLLMLIEAMKMEHRILAPSPGTVAKVRVATGDQVDAGTVLAVIDQDDDQ
ncbi:MAG: biotin carboxylase N-terminal domain-containing protein [Euzebya sp.]